MKELRIDNNITLSWISKWDFFTNLLQIYYDNHHFWTLRKLLHGSFKEMLFEGVIDMLTKEQLKLNEGSATSMGNLSNCS